MTHFVDPQLALSLNWLLAPDFLSSLQKIQRKKYEQTLDYFAHMRKIDPTKTLAALTYHPMQCSRNTSLFSIFILDSAFAYIRCA
jgi:hypothetical protein